MKKLNFLTAGSIKMKYKELSTEVELLLWQDDKYSCLPFRNFILSWDGSLTKWQEEFFNNYSDCQLEKIYKRMRWRFNYKAIDGTNYNIKQKLIIMLSKASVKKDGTITMPFYDYFIKKLGGTL